MATIRSALEGELEAIASLVSRLQASPETHTAFFGESSDDIRSEILDWGPEWRDRALVAVGGDELVGFVGLHLDGDSRRGWIFGQSVELGSRDEVAELLLDRCLAAAGDRELELGSDVADTRLAEPAARGSG